MGGKTRDLTQRLNCPERIIHLLFFHFVGDHNDFSTCRAGVELHDRLDRDTPFTETLSDFADHTRSILGVESNVMALTDLACIHKDALSPAPCGQKGVNLSGSPFTGLPDSSDVENIRHHC